MLLPSIDEIREAQSILYRHMPPTPQYSWPLLNERLDGECWVKHENFTPVGAFKIRGALVYMDWLRRQHPDIQGVVAATRGNHGQGVGLAARLEGLKAIIVVPHGNSREKNRAMLAQGVELIEYGSDFQEALEYAETVATERGYVRVESFHEQLVRGTATYALEFFEGTSELERIYVPIGLGSSICGVAAARNALGKKTEIVGVVAAGSPSYSHSFREHRVMEAPATTQIADGLSCRRPNQQAMDVIWKNVFRIIEVPDEEIAEAMRIYYQDAHQLAEGAGAAALAGALREKNQNRGKRIGVVLTGSNVDCDVYRKVLGGDVR